MDNIVSIIGAAAWIPIIGKSIIDIFRKINVVYLDNHFVYNVEDALINTGEKLENQTGMILILALNLFVYEKPFFAKDILCELELKNGVKYKSILYEGEISYRDIEKSSEHYIYQLPISTNINSNRLIVPNLDNIRIIPFWFEELNLHDDKNIEKIIIKFQGRFLTKKVILKNSDCIKMNYINKFIVNKDDNVQR